MTPGANFSTDPRIRYDRLSGRWFITMIDVPGQQGTQPNRVMIAMSDSGIISGSTVWTFFQFSGDASNFADYPTLGIDANALYIGANIFSTTTGSFVNTSAFVVRKSSLLSGGPIVVTAFTGLIVNSGRPPRATGPETPQGVDNYDPTATEGYFIGVDRTSTSRLQLRRVTNPGGTPSLSGNVSISVSSFASPINVTVQGTSGTVDGLDRRLLAAHYRNGSLWTTHNVGVNSTGGTSSPDRDGVRWYQINGIATGQSPSVAQSGTVFQSGSANLSYWMGTIMVSGQGHAAMGFTRAGPNDFLDAAFTGRLAGDASGTMGAPVAYTASTSAYNPSDGINPHRWGDYSYTGLDPSDDMTMWTIQEWCQSSGNGYAVQVAQLLAPPPALPTNCTPSSVTQNVANVSVVLKGSAANGAGFFDPGAAFPNHIAASINGGGVTVNSIAYNNPTNVTVNLTVAPNAALGARTITVTNPDGQSATSASGILTVVISTNSPPTLAAISNRTIIAGMTLTIANTATDPDSPPQVLTFSLGSGAATNASINPTNGVFVWSPTQSQRGTNAFRVIVTDNGTPSLNATQAFSVTVLASNNPPVLAAIADYTIAEGVTLTVTNVATDPDSPPQALTFSLGPGAAPNATINAINGVFIWSPTQAQIGTNAFSVIVTDNGLPSLSATQGFQVTVLASNSPPELVAIADYTIAEGMALTITNTATDPDSPPQVLTFSLDPGAATNASINPTNGVFVWSPTQSQLGTNAFGVIATDNGTPSLSATQTFSVTVLASNHPPVLAAIADYTIAEGMTLTITNTATDPDSPPQVLTFSLGSGAATNASINPTNGVFVWSPTQSQLGTNAFGVIVTDNGTPSLSATQTFSVTVLASNNPPALTPIADQTLYALKTLRLTNSATDLDLAAQILTFSLEPGAPDGASIDATSGVLMWTPADWQVGTNIITVRVTDNGLPNLNDAKSFAVNVLPRPVLETLGSASNTTALTWSAITGTTYRVQFKISLTDTSWVDLVPDVLATGATASATDTFATNDARFYRVIVVP